MGIQDSLISPTSKSQNRQLGHSNYVELIVLQMVSINRFAVSVLPPHCVVLISLNGSGKNLTESNRS